MRRVESVAGQSLLIFEQEIAPGVWLRQTEPEGQFVEIVLPLSEMRQVVRTCEQDFPRYAATLLQMTAERQPEAVTPQTEFAPELMTGILNTQILGTLLQSRQGLEAQPAYPMLERAFSLAFRGRLKLTAEPLDVGPVA